MAASWARSPAGSSTSIPNPYPASCIAAGSSLPKPISTATRPSSTLSLTERRVPKWPRSRPMISGSASAVTRLEAREAAARYCFPEPPVTVVVGPAERLRSQLERFGPVEVLSADDVL